MPQFRLTKKFSIDCKVNNLSEPLAPLHPLDDWGIDRMVVDRRKVAIITHVKSAYTFFIPYADAGGAKGIVACFKMRLIKLFHDNGIDSMVKKTDRLFSGDYFFTKKVDRRLLGHMNDFRRCAMPYPEDPRPIDWADEESRINNMTIKGGIKDWMYPVERFSEIIGANLPKRQ